MRVSGSQIPRLVAAAISVMVFGGQVRAAAERSATSPPPVDAGSVLQVVFGLGLVLVAIGASAWVLRHLLRIQPGMNGQLRVLAGISMGPREKVVLLKVGDTQLLLGVAPGRVHTLHVLARPLEESAEANAGGSGFAAQLSRALHKTVRGRDA